jgi:hypothetical protein
LGIVQAGTMVLDAGVEQDYRDQQMIAAEISLAASSWM